MVWVCPDCGRKFARNNQSHSCEQYPKEDLFIGKDPEVIDLYRILENQVMAFGEVEAHTGKFNMTFRRLSTFMAVMIEKGHLTISFISREPIDDFPVYQNYHHSNNRYSNAVKVESPEEIDDQLVTWLRQSWELAV